MTPKIGICLSFHGGHRKNEGVTLAADRHIDMLEAVIARLTRHEAHPVIISMIAWKAENETPETLARMRTLASEHFIVHTPDDEEHQMGAMKAVFAGIKAAYERGIDWLFVAAEDIVFPEMNPARYYCEKAIELEVDYFGRPWLDDVGIQAISTQGFCCRVKALYDAEKQWFPFLPEYFDLKGYPHGFEHYTIQALKNNGLKFHRDWNFSYHHTHDPDELLRLAGGPFINDRAPKHVLLRFRHGLGDCVQLTAVLAHLKKHRPDWLIDVEAGDGKHGLFFGQCRKTFLMGSGSAGGYHLFLNLDWHENYLGYRDTLNTKTTRCLREIFQIEPELDLLRYAIHPNPSSDHAAHFYLASVGAVLEGKKRNSVIIHYQGNTSANGKNLDHETIRALCRRLRENNKVPVILDWDHRSPLPDGKTIFCPNSKHSLWGNNNGHGSAHSIAALIEASCAFIGIDSGPLHVAGATTTPTIGIWTIHQPIRYFDLADNVVHLLPLRWRTMEPCHVPEIAALQAKHYRLRTYSGRLPDDVIDILKNDFKLKLR